VSQYSDSYSRYIINVKEHSKPGQTVTIQTETASAVINTDKLVSQLFSYQRRLS